MKTAIITLFVLVVSLNLPAQNTWTLEQCIDYALENNIQVKQQQIVVEQNKNNLAQSKYALLPSVNASGGYYFGWGRTLNYSTNQYVDVDRTENSDFGISASVPLFAGLQKQNTIRQNNISLQASIQDIEKLKNDVTLNVTAGYLQILLAKENVAIAEQQVISTKEQAERTKKMVDAGKVTLSNWLDLQSQLASEESQLVKAQNELRTAYLILKQLLELNDENSFDVTIPEILTLPESFNENLQAIYNEALNIMPEIKGSELRLKMAEKGLDIARGSYFPSLSLSASVNTRYSSAHDYSFWKQFREERGETVGIGLSIPIFGGLQTRTQVKNAKLSITHYNLELQRTKNELYKSIQQAQIDASGYLKSYQAAQKNVDAIKEAFYYTEKKFEAGSVTSTDYTVAKNNLFKAESDLIQAKYQYIFKVKILDFYKGLAITL